MNRARGTDGGILRIPPNMGSLCFGKITATSWTSIRPPGMVRDVRVRDDRWFKVLPPVLLCATLWGSAFPSIKTVYRMWDQHGVHVGLAEIWWFAGVRFTLAGIALLLVAKNPWKELKATDKKLLLGFSATQTFGQYLLFYYALSVSSGALAGLLSSLGSFWWMILAPLLGGAPWPGRSQWLAIGIGAVGVTLAASAPGADAGNPWIGTLLLGACTGLGAVGIIQFGKLRDTIGARAATGFSLLIGGLGLLAAGAPAFPRAAELMLPEVMAVTAWLAFVSAFAFSLWNHLSTIHPMPLLAGYRFLIPIMGITASVVLLGEKPGWGLLAGGVLVIGALVVAQRSSERM